MTWTPVLALPPDVGPLCSPSLESLPLSLIPHQTPGSGLACRPPGAHLEDEIVVQDISFCLVS